MITSTKNPKVQWVRRLQNKSKARQAEEVFVVEGVRLLEEVLSSNWRASYLFHTEELGERGMHLVSAFHTLDTQVEAVSTHVMEVISDTKNPQGILGVIEMQKLSVPSQLDFLLLLDQIREPGNLGTIIRSAAAAGVQAVYLSPGTVDPFSPKVLRAGMGAHFRLPIRAASWADLRSQINHHKLHAYLASSGDGDLYYISDFEQPLVLIIGGESEGASQTASEITDTQVQIPMPGGGESLNASVAAGILLFDVARQREKKL